MVRGGVRRVQVPVRRDIEPAHTRGPDGLDPTSVLPRAPTSTGDHDPVPLRGDGVEVDAVVLAHVDRIHPVGVIGIHAPIIEPIADALDGPRATDSTHWGGAKCVSNPPHR